MKTLTALTMALLAVFFLHGPSANADDCAECAGLDVLAREIEVEAKKPDANLKKLHGQARDLILKMTSDSPKMSDEKVSKIVSILRASVPYDPARVIVDYILPVLKTHRAVIEAKIAKLPKEESSDLLNAIDTAIRAETEGPDVPPPPKPQPAKRKSK